MAKKLQPSPVYPLRNDMAGMEGEGFLPTPTFFRILSDKEQKFVTDMMFPGHGDVAMHGQPMRGLVDGERTMQLENRKQGLHAVPSLPFPPVQNARGTVRERSGNGDCMTQGPPSASSFLSRGYSHTSHDSSTPNPSFSPASVKYGGSLYEKKDTPSALSAALDRLTASLNTDGTLPLSTFETIVKELSGIECLQTMLLFRPNKKKGKGGRQPAKDPRLDPNMDPRKAKRIVANRQSAARSKQKQKRHVESLHLQHDTLMIQMLLCEREKEKLDHDISATEQDTRLLETELQAMVQHVRRVQNYVLTVTQERDSLKREVEALSSSKPAP